MLAYHVSLILLITFVLIIIFQIRKTHAEEKNEILKKNEMLERSIEDFKDTMYLLEEEVSFPLLLFY